VRWPSCLSRPEDTDNYKHQPSHHRSIQPSPSAGRVQRLCLPVVGLLLLASILSSSIVLFNVGRSGSTLQLELGLLDEESLGHNWRFVPTTGPALGLLNATERPTLAETFFTPKCAEDWITAGTLCKQITQGVITHNTRNALRMSIIHTWVNGSDKRLHAWKDAIVNSHRPIFTIKKFPGAAARHFR